MYFPLVGPMKKFKNKKSMFAKIAQEIQDEIGAVRTADQCSTRYKTVSKRKKNARDQNNKSGNSPQIVEYEDELEKIRFLDDSLEPEIVRDSAGVVSQKSSPPSLSAHSETTDGSSSLSESNEQNRDEQQKKKKESTGRMQHMKFFLDSIAEIEARKAERKAAREQERQKRRLEKDKRREDMHKEKMDLLRALVGMKANNE